MDDILDETGDSRLLGKATGQDRQNAKATNPALIGMSGARQEAENLVAEALRALKPFSQVADSLRTLARFILTSTH